MLVDIDHLMFAGSGSFTLALASNVANPNLLQLSTAAGWDGSAPVVVDITAALINTITIPNTWSFPGGLTLRISAGTRVGGVANGGAAIITRVPIKIDDLGTISGGGGRGGNGQGVYVQPTPGSNSGQYFVGGGGGGTGQGFAAAGSLAIVNAAAGEPGGSQFTFGPDSSGQGGYGGGGGNWGAAGVGGNFGGYSPAGGQWYAPTAAGPVGAYIDGNSFVTWLSTGQRFGNLT